MQKDMTGEEVRTLKIYQISEGYCYNSDSLFLWDFIGPHLHRGHKVLEVGSGSGVIGLLCARDVEISLFQVELQREYALLNLKNAIANNIFSHIINTDCRSMLEHKTLKVDVWAATDGKNPLGGIPLWTISGGSDDLSQKGEQRESNGLGKVLETSQSSMTRSLGRIKSQESKNIESKNIESKNNLQNSRKIKSNKTESNNPSTESTEQKIFDKQESACVDSYVDPKDSQNINKVDPKNDSKIESDKTDSKNSHDSYLAQDSKNQDLKNQDAKNTESTHTQITQNEEEAKKSLLKKIDSKVLNIKLEYFDVMISNPPFYPSGTLESKNAFKKVATQDSYLPLEKLIDIAKKILKPSGKLIFCYLASELPRIFNLLELEHFGIEKMRLIYPKADKNAIRVMIVARRNAKPQMIIMPPLITHIGANQGDNSNEVVRIYKSAKTHSIKLELDSILAL